jgi:hypothetical protein
MNTACPWAHGVAVCRLDRCVADEKSLEEIDVQWAENQVPNDAAASLRGRSVL